MTFAPAHISAGCCVEMSQGPGAGRGGGGSVLSVKKTGPRGIRQVISLSTKSRTLQITCRAWRGGLALVSIGNKITVRDYFSSALLSPVRKPVVENVHRGQPRGTISVTLWQWDSRQHCPHMSSVSKCSHVLHTKTHSVEKHLLLNIAT